MTTDQVITNEQATTNPEEVEKPRPRRRGFAAMDPARIREIASKGGRAAHAAGTAHEFSSDEARAAGRKGGTAAHVSRGMARPRPASGNVPASSDASGAPSER